MSIYDSIGGAPAVRAAVDDFYARVLADRRLAPFFARTDLERLKTHQRAFIAAAIGGPEIFAGRDMALAHAGLGIGDGDFDAVVTHLAGTLTELGAPEDTIGQIASALAPLRDEIVTTRRAELAGQHPQSPPPLPAVASSNMTAAPTSVPGAGRVRRRHRAGRGCRRKVPAWRRGSCAAAGAPLAPLASSAPRHTM